MFVPAGGHLLNTITMGTGPRTLVAHGGWVGGWELWQQPFELLQDSWRCIAYDHRGAGASTAPSSALTPQALVDDLFAVLDHEGVERCVLAGESLGALTVLAAYHAQPSRFRGLVIVDGVTSTGGNSGRADQVRLHYRDYVAAFVDACVPEPDSDHLQRWGRQILERAEPEAAARMLEVHEDAHLAPALGDIGVPTLVIHGEQDAIVPVDVGRDTATRIPGADLVVIPETGHVPTITRPVEVAAAIQRWAERLPS